MEFPLLFGRSGDSESSEPENSEQNTESDGVQEPNAGDSLTDDGQSVENHDGQSVETDDGYNAETDDGESLDTLDGCNADSHDLQSVENHGAGQSVDSHDAHSDGYNAETDNEDSIETVNMQCAHLEDRHNLDHGDNKRRSDINYFIIDFIQYVYEINNVFLINKSTKK